MTQQQQKMNLVGSREKEEEYESIMNKDQQFLDARKNWFRNQRLDEFLTEDEVMIVSNVLDTFDNLWKNMDRTKAKYHDFHIQLKENERTLATLNKELDEMENAFITKTQMELMHQAQLQEERQRELQKQREALTMDFQTLAQQVEQQVQELRDLKTIPTLSDMIEMKENNLINNPTNSNNQINDINENDKQEKQEEKEIKENDQK